MRIVRRILSPVSAGRADAKMELAAEMGIPRPRGGTVVTVGKERIEFTRAEVDGIIDRTGHYRPRDS